jgi:hypothetical protein
MANVSVANNTLMSCASVHANHNATESATRAHTHLTARRSTHLLLEEQLHHLLYDGQQTAVVHSNAALEQGQDVLNLSAQGE